MLPLSPEVLAHEIASVKAVVDKWSEKIAQGIPGVDAPPSGNMDSSGRLDVWLTELIGEMRLVSGKADNIAQVLANTYLE